MKFTSSFQKINFYSLSTSALITILALSSCGDSNGDNSDTQTQTDTTLDSDSDGVLDSQDAFPNDPDETLDTDQDDIGNNADLDDDGDGISDLIEGNLGFDPLDSTSVPLDFDGDGQPNVLDDDDDNDGYSDLIEESESTDSLDDQSIPADNDSDFDPDSSDEDDDNDGYTDTIEDSESTDPLDDQSVPADNDSDFDPDSTDEDDDNDGYSDVLEATEMTDPFDAQSKPVDTDGDFEPDSTDADIDGDEVLNEDDLYPLDSTEWADFDGDGVGDNTDPDDDNDGFNDEEDAFAFLVGEWVDTDEDGVGDNSDIDSTDSTCWSDADGSAIEGVDLGCDQFQEGITNIDLSKIEGHNGLTMSGAVENDRFGKDVNGLGDINNDGFDDFAVSAYWFDIEGGNAVGKLYVIFGSANKFEENLDFAVDDLDGTNGFEITGTINLGQLGSEFNGIGDINDDGFDDFMIMSQKSPSDVYVVFGKGSTWGAEFDLTSLDGSNGFTLTGGGGSSRKSALLGDVNNDGISDFALPEITVSGEDPNAVYLLFGRSEAWPASIDLTDLDSVSTYGRIIEYAFTVSGVGDINGDNIDDIGLRVSGVANVIGTNGAGTVGVIYGQENLHEIDLNQIEYDGVDGFAVQGENSGDVFGHSITSSDLNNDGFSDLIVGADIDDRAGRVYVIFGAEQMPSTMIEISQLDGTNGLVLIGESVEDYTGAELDGIKDFNGDGINDLLIGSRFSEVNEIVNAGRAFVVFGSETDWPNSINLFEMNSSVGVTFDGFEVGSRAGSRISDSGDVNGDGLSDILIGVLYVDSNGKEDAGQAYLIYGFDQFKSNEE